MKITGNWKDITDLNMDSGEYEKLEKKGEKEMKKKGEMQQAYKTKRHRLFPYPTTIDEN